MVVEIDAQMRHSFLCDPQFVAARTLVPFFFSCVHERVRLILTNNQTKDRLRCASGGLYYAHKATLCRHQFNIETLGRNRAAQVMP